jgi:superfamily I DNA/RNA helicase
VSRITAVEPDRVDAVLARTNAGVMVEAMKLIARGRTPCILGGTDELNEVLQDVVNLKRGYPAESEKFFGLNTWAEARAHSETPEGREIRSIVQMVEAHGTRQLQDTLEDIQDEEGGGAVVLSTTHRAKGREWDSVRIADDFVSYRPNKNKDEDTRLFYVAMTRAKRLLVVDRETMDHFTE